MERSGKCPGKVQESPEEGPEGRPGRVQERVQKGVHVCVQEKVQEGVHRRIQEGVQEGSRKDSTRSGRGSRRSGKGLGADSVKHVVFLMVLATCLGKSLKIHVFLWWFQSGCDFPLTIVTPNGFRHPGASFEFTFTVVFELWSKKAKGFIAKVSRAQISAYYSSVWWIRGEKQQVLIAK